MMVPKEYIEHNAYGRRHAKFSLYEIGTGLLIVQLSV